MPTNDTGQAKDPGKIRLALAAIIIASLLLRAFYFIEQRNGAMEKAHLMETTDMLFFHQWADIIASGDILVTEPFHPYPGELDKESMNILVRKGWADPANPPEIPSKALWDIFLNGKVFHQEPLYPYLTAAVYRLSGKDDPGGVYLLQMAAGTVMNVLIFLIALRLFGFRAAIASGAISVLYGPFLFFEYTLLRTSLSGFFAVALTYLGLVALEKDNRRWWAIFGFSTGVGMMIRMYFVLFPAIIFLAGLLEGRKAPLKERMLKGAAPLALGMFLALLPAMARNVAVGVSPSALAGNAAMTFIDGNSAFFDPRDGLVRNWENIYNIMSSTEGRLLPTVSMTISTHPGISDYFLLLVNKFSASLSWREIANNVNYYYYKTHSTALALAPLTFFTVAPLVFAGVYLAFRDRKSAWAPLAMAGIVLFTMVVFFPLARYRIPMIAALIPFAGYAADKALRSKKAIAAIGVAALLYWPAAMLAGSPLPLIAANDYANAAALETMPAITGASGKEDWKEAARLYRDWINYESGFGIDFNSPGKVHSQILVPAFQTYAQYAQAARLAGLEREAAEAGEKALTLKKELVRRGARFK